VTQRQALAALPCPNGCPYEWSRLLITPLGDGRFTAEVTRGLISGQLARNSAVVL
jgi:hypothetical protein